MYKIILAAYLSFLIGGMMFTLGEQLPASTRDLHGAISGILTLITIALLAYLAGKEE